MIINVWGIPRPWPKENRRQGQYKPYKVDKKGYWAGWHQSFTTQVKVWMNQNNIKMFPKGVPLAMGYLIFIPRPKTVKRLYPTVIPDFDNYKYGMTNLLKGLLYYDDDQIVVDLEGGLYYADQIEPCVYLKYFEIFDSPITEYVLREFLSSQFQRLSPGQIIRALNRGTRIV